MGDIRATLEGFHRFPIAILHCIHYEVRKLLHVKNEELGEEGVSLTDAILRGESLGELLIGADLISKRRNTVND
ncbi:hypothetical protein GBA52_025984 [Prunus armeniaca]|nr:hypothetical protein GBA52_025984 [Prunus armeniaca]